MRELTLPARLLRERPTPLRAMNDDPGGPTSMRTANAPLLSPADEVRLARRVELGDTTAKQKMVEGNIRLVYAIARPYRAYGVPFADIVQEGTVGLVKAVERFDHRRGLKFSTYASWWIRRSVLDALSDARLIRIPPKANQQLAAVRRAQLELQRAGTPLASAEAISGSCGLPMATVIALLGAARVTASLDEPIGEDAGSLSEIVADDRAADPFERTAEREERDRLAELLRLLPARHRQVIRSRYGLGGSPVQSHQQIGDLLGVGEERSRQLEREALNRLRSIMASSQRTA